MGRTISRHNVAAVPLETIESSVAPRHMRGEQLVERNSAFSFRDRFTGHAEPLRAWVHESSGIRRFSGREDRPELIGSFRCHPSAKRSLPWQPHDLPDPGGTTNAANPRCGSGRRGSAKGGLMISHNTVRSDAAAEPVQKPTSTQRSHVGFYARLPRTVTFRSRITILHVRSRSVNAITLLTKAFGSVIASAMRITA
jgi:hypothetical protein